MASMTRATSPAAGGTPLSGAPAGGLGASVGPGVDPGAAGPGRARGARQHQVTDFAALSKAVQATGLLRRRYAYYWAKLVGMLALLVSQVVAFVLIGDTWWQLLLAGLLAATLTQLAFLAHDAAHRQIFVSGRWNEWTSLLLANVLSGMSHGWWTSKHTRHHANPNKVGLDPDIESEVLAFTPEAMKGRRGMAAWLAARQGWFFFPLLLLEGVNLHAKGIQRLVRRGEVRRRWVELAMIGTRLGGYLVLVFLVLPPGKGVAFLGVQLGLYGLYMGCAFAPNHKGMPVVPPDVKIDFLRRQVLMSRNIRGGRLVDVAMGGLNYQIEHHLFPSMPRPNLRRVQPLVRAYCEQHGIPYTQTGLFASYRIVVGYLNRVGLGAREPFVCPLVASYRRH